MNKRLSGIIIGAIVVIAAIWLITTYNALVKKQEKVSLQWNEVQNAYQRRLDLIPNLVNVVKGGADFEQSTLQKIAAARAKAQSLTVTNVTAENVSNVTAAQNELAQEAMRLVAVIEKYPDLKGAKAFLDLQAQLEGTERRIKFARKDFNEAIQDYNSRVKTFPTKLVAGILGFLAKEGFVADDGAEKAVEIKF
ncbi:MAG: LemA family protein [Chitinophagaceae bacterium]|jgi:LemA protein|nr:LemA family protein [Chitinophagaceae bacterium]MBP6047392.1 LemA family protein [Ferruginibacter sp.]NMD29550.1 LemA family protein [Bacteroidota bacterium]MBK7090021.1 LemA family protein [Chitinophagaceae bacterium]MBK7346047.1 LemA family protein [Chitinophagaceae bacterium]